MNLIGIALPSCVSKQYCQFNGQITHGNPPIAVEGYIHEIGAQSSNFPKDLAVGQFSVDIVDGGAVVLLFDNKFLKANGYHFTNESFKGTWYIPSLTYQKIDWNKFLKSSDQDRAISLGFVPTKGIVNIDRWENGMDLKVQVSISTVEKSPTTFDGTINIYSQDEWHPILAVALILSQFGIGSE